MFSIVRYRLQGTLFIFGIFYSSFILLNVRFGTLLGALSCALDKVNSN
jgi:hypothetical protein